MNRTLLIPALMTLCASASANQITLYATQDNTLYVESGSVSNGAGSFLFSSANAMGSARRALVRFDVAGSLPAGSTITAVQLVLHVSQANPGAVVQSVHRVGASWGEGASDAPGPEGSGTAAAPNDATWTERFFGAALPWTTPGGDFAPTASTSLAIDGVATWTFPSTPALIADVQDMLDVPANDFGWIVIGSTAASTSKRYDSRHGSDLALVPQLLVSFDPPCLTPIPYCVAAANSAGTGGAVMGWSGQPSIYTGTFALACSGLPSSTTGVFYFGPTSTQVPFGNGVRCVSGQVRRLGMIQASGGAVQHVLDFTHAPASDITPGTQWSFQFWYRDVAAGGAAFNLSNGLTVTFCH